jgi:hypothetical protein
VAAAKQIAIKDDVKAILRDSIEIDGPNVRFVRELERKDWNACAKVLQALGGKWNRKQQAVVFDIDAESLIEYALGSGKVENRRTTLQQFFTKPALALQMLQMLDITERDRFLEPSAGEGALVLPMLGDKVPRPAVIVMIEIDERTHAKLINVAEAFRVVVPDYPVAALHDDFLALELDYRPSVICMNPPFTEGRAEAHTRKAYEMLAPGGRMAAIAGESDFNPGKTAFPGWLAAHGAVIKPAPDDGFENTTARARIIYMTKP